nr:MAG TPA: hypothetical protein [Caudoviricetes sp.]
MRLRIEVDHCCLKRVLVQQRQQCATVTLTCEKMRKNHMTTVATVNAKICNSDFRERCDKSVLNKSYFTVVQQWQQ